MSSWDGGILDSLRSGGDDISAFFSSALGKGLVTGFSAGNAKKDVATRKTNVISTEGYAPADLTRETDFNESEDFSRIEAEWYERLRRFSGLTDPVKDTEVRMG
jgi:hypothetical protein